MRILEARPSDVPVAPGVVQVHGGGVVAGFAGGAIGLVRVQPEGRRPLDAVAWMHGRRGEALRFTAPEG